MNLSSNEWMAVVVVLGIMFGMVKWSAGNLYDQQKKSTEDARANDREMYKLLEAERKMEARIFELEIRILREMLISSRSKG